ncbi:MAG: ABC transporter ATP-binding protein [Gemmatimonadaceae bacterium]
MPTERISPWREIRSLAQGRWREISIIALLVSLGTLASIFEPWIYSAIIDDIAGILVADNSEALIGRFVQDVLQTAANLGASAVRILSAPLRGSLELEARTIPEAFATIATGAVLMVLMRIVAQACAAAGDNRAARLGSDVEQDIIGKTYRHVLRLPLGFFQRRASGTIAKQVDQSDAIAPIVSGVAEEVWPELFTLVAILSIMLVVDPSLALVTLVSVPVYAAVTWRMTRALDAGMDEYYAAWDDIVARLQESIQGIKTVRAFGAADHEASELNEHMGEAYEAYLARTRLQNCYGPLQSAIIVITQGSVLAIGGYQALQHQLSPGAVVLFLTYLDRLYGPIESLTGSYTPLQPHLASPRTGATIAGASLRCLARISHRPAPRGAIDAQRDLRLQGHRVLDGITFSVAWRKDRNCRTQRRGRPRPPISSPPLSPPAGSLRIDDTDTSRVAPSSVRYVRGVAVDGTTCAACATTHDTAGSRPRTLRSKTRSSWRCRTSR